MPYEWIDRTDPDAPTAELHLWPYRSLPRRGFVWIIAMGFALFLVPLLAFLGSVVLWGLLPFALLTMGGLWFSIEKSYKDGEVLEELKIWPDRMILTRHEPAQNVMEWEANTYWVSVTLHKHGGPVPDYVTLTGNGRKVELGAFLSEDERPRLYQELQSTITRVKSHGTSG